MHFLLCQVSLLFTSCYFVRPEEKNKTMQAPSLVGCGSIWLNRRRKRAAFPNSPFDYMKKKKKLRKTTWLSVVCRWSKISWQTKKEALLIAPLSWRVFKRGETSILLPHSKMLNTLRTVLHADAKRYSAKAECGCSHLNTDTTDLIQFWHSLCKVIAVHYKPQQTHPPAWQRYIDTLS